MKKILILLLLVCILLLAPTVQCKQKMCYAVDTEVCEKGLYAIYPTVKGVGAFEMDGVTETIIRRHVLILREAKPVTLNDCFAIPITSPTDEVTEDGEYLVGKDVKPGLYKITSVSDTSTVSFYVYNKNRHAMIGMPKISTLVNDGYVTLVDNTIIDCTGLTLKRRE